MLYVRFPLSLRNVEDLLHERGIEISHETVRFWWNRFGPMFAAEIRRNRVSRMRSYSNWQWHLDEVFVKINGETHYLWRAVDHEGEVLESYVTKRRDRKAALKFLRKAMKRYGGPEVVVTDKLRSYGAAMKVVGNADRQETGRWVNNRAENSHLPFRRRERAMLRFRQMRCLQKFAAVHSSPCMAGDTCDFDQYARHTVNALTTYDGYAMTRRGAPSRALSLAYSASFFGGCFSIAAALIAPVCLRALFA